MSYEEQDVIWRVALASYDPREMRVWTRYLEERNPAIRCTGYRSSRPLLERLEQGDVDVLVLLSAVGVQEFAASSFCPGYAALPASLWCFCGTTDATRSRQWRA